MNQDSQIIIDAATRQSATIDDLNTQHQVDAGIIQKLTDQLKAATADQTAAADLLVAQQRLSRLTQLTKPNVGLNLHRLPSTQDPNARPVMTWFQPGNTGNTGGGSAVKHGTWTITQLDDHTEFAIVPAKPNDNFFWPLNLLKSNTAFSRYLQVTEFEMPDEAVLAAMGVETNWEHSYNGFRINAGIQALLGVDKDAVTGKLVTEQWRYYDIGSGHWQDTGIPFDRSMFGTGKRIELVSEFAEGFGGMQNISLRINGTPHAVNKFSKAVPTNWGPYLQIGWQMDSLSSAKPFTTKIWNSEAYWI